MKGCIRFTACVVLAFTAALAQAQQQMLVTSFSSNSVSRFDLTTGAFLGTLDLSANLSGPLCTRLGPDGRLYVASEGTGTIERFDASTGAHLGTFIAPGSGGLTTPSGVTWGPDGHLYVSSFTGNSVLKYDGVTGAFMSTFIASGIGGINGADNGTHFGPDNNLYIPSYNNNRILRKSASGGFVTTFVSTISRPRVLEFRAGSAYVTAEGSDSVMKYDLATGASQGAFVAAGSGGLDAPTGMVFAPDGSLYVSSVTNDNVLRYDATTGAFVNTFIPAGAGGIDGPVFLTIIPAPGAVLVLAMGVLGLNRRARTQKRS
jgi:DNA-binding beta-propeller fold protein YncE